MPLIPLILFGLGILAIGVLSEEAKAAAQKIEIEDYKIAKKLLQDLRQLKPEVLSELYSKRDKLSPIVAQNLERFLNEKIGRSL